MLKIFASRSKCIVWILLIANTNTVHQINYVEIIELLHEILVIMSIVRQTTCLQQNRET